MDLQTRSGTSYSVVRHSWHPGPHAMIAEEWARWQTECSKRWAAFKSGYMHWHLSCMGLLNSDRLTADRLYVEQTSMAKDEVSTTVYNEQALFKAKSGYNLYLRSYILQTRNMHHMLGEVQFA